MVTPTVTPEQATKEYLEGKNPYGQTRLSIVQARGFGASVEADILGPRGIKATPENVAKARAYLRSRGIKYYQPPITRAVTKEGREIETRTVVQEGVATSTRVDVTPTTTKEVSGVELVKADTPQKEQVEIVGQTKAGGIKVKHKDGRIETLPPSRVQFSDNGEEIYYKTVVTDPGSPEEGRGRVVETIPISRQEYIELGVQRRTEESIERMARERLENPLTTLGLAATGIPTLRTPIQLVTAGGTYIFGGQKAFEEYQKKVQEENVAIVKEMIQEEPVVALGKKAAESYGSLALLSVPAIGIGRVGTAASRFVPKSVVSGLGTAAKVGAAGLFAGMTALGTAEVVKGVGEVSRGEVTGYETATGGLVTAGFGALGLRALGTLVRPKERPKVLELTTKPETYREVIGLESRKRIGYRRGTYDKQLTDLEITQRRILGGETTRPQAKPFELAFEKTTVRTYPSSDLGKIKQVKREVGIKDPVTGKFKPLKQDIQYLQYKEYRDPITGELRIALDRPKTLKASEFEKIAQSRLRKADVSIEEFERQIAIEKPKKFKPLIIEGKPRTKVEPKVVKEKPRQTLFEFLDIKEARNGAIAVKRPAPKVKPTRQPSLEELQSLGRQRQAQRLVQEEQYAVTPMGFELQRPAVVRQFTIPARPRTTRFILGTTPRRDVSQDTFTSVRMKDILKEQEKQQERIALRRPFPEGTLTVPETTTITIPGSGRVTEFVQDVKTDVGTGLRTGLPSTFGGEPGKIDILKKRRIFPFEPIIVRGDETRKPRRRKGFMLDELFRFRTFKTAETPWSVPVPKILKRGF